MLSHQNLSDTRELGVAFLVNKEIADNIEEFYNINESAAVIVIKPNRRYKLKIVQVYASTSGHEEVESLYEDLESAMGKVKTQYTVLMGDFMVGSW